MRLRRNGAAARGAWTLASQAADAISNLVLTIAVARAVVPREFGAFSAVYVAVQFAILLVRAGTTMPVLIFYSARLSRRSHRLMRYALGSNVAVGLALLPPCVVVGLLLGGTIGSVLVATGVAMVGLLVQDAVCTVFIFRGAPAGALVNNLSWLVVQVVAFAAVAGTHLGHQPWFLLLVWAAAAYVADVISLVQLRVLPALWGAVYLWRRHRRSIVELATDAAVQQGAQLGVTYIVGVGVDLAGVAAIRAATVPFGLLRTALQGMVPLGVVEGARLYARDPARLQRLVRLGAVASVAVTVVLGVALEVMPVAWGRAVLGESWPLARSILLMTTISGCGFGVMLTAQMGLRAIGATRLILALRLPVSAVQLLATLAGALAGGLHGATIGLAASSVFSAVLVQVMLDRAVREGRRVRVPGRHRVESVDTRIG